MEPPLTWISPQGSHKAPAPTFSTFQIMNLTRRSCQGLGFPPEPQPSPGGPAVHTVASPLALGAASIPEAERAEEVPAEEGGLSLQAETRAWFQKTQAQGLLQHGAAPAWFHGFITRREAESLLEPQPQGCYLVRFSESAVTFVLTYRSRTCCRHFLLAQLRDGRHVVLGEDSVHARLQDLLQHYTTRPLGPYREMLTQPLARQPPRPKPPIPRKLQLPPEVYTSPARRPRPTPPPEPTHPIYHEPDEPIAFYAMGRGSPGEAPSNVYAEVEGPSAPGSTWHPVLRKCRSRPGPGGQNPGGPQLYSEAGQGPPQPHQPPRPWRHTLPHNPSRHLQQAWLPLGPSQ